MILFEFVCECVYIYIYIYICIYIYIYIYIYLIKLQQINYYAPVGWEGTSYNFWRMRYLEFWTQRKKKQ